MPVERIRMLIATLWVGSIWTIGYLAAPTLFTTLADRVLAGTIAGSLFRSQAWLSVACAIAMLALLRGQATGKRRVQTWQIAAAMLACTVIGYFGLQPFMAALKAAAGPGGVMDAEARTRFGVLHGVSSAIYLVQSLLGAALIWRLAGRSASAA
ncbi:DUF4149 domain-containing protein [Oxalobacteraceae bacterium OM1]|nr:DUF4149 domain-containing protein [Oxalobacteraceae bacterium OM1]